MASQPIRLTLTRRYSHAQAVTLYKSPNLLSSDSIRSSAYHTRAEPISYLNGVRIQLSVSKRWYVSFVNEDQRILRAEKDSLKHAHAKPAS